MIGVLSFLTMSERFFNFLKQIFKHSNLESVSKLLAIVVVFATTYVLILPGFTLDQETASRQGGIDVPAVAAEENVDMGKNAENETDKEKAADTDTDIGDAGVQGDDNKNEETADAKNKENTEDAKDAEYIKDKKFANNTEPEELIFEGDDYTVTVIDKNSILPEAAHVESEEIRKDSRKQAETFDEYVAKTEEALGWDEGTVSYARIFDIKIVDGEGNKFDIPEPVDVSISLADRVSGEGSKGSQKTEPASTEDLHVVHFPDGSEEGEEVRSSTENGEDGSVVEFEADGFSVYSIVEAPEPVDVNSNVSALDDIEEGQEYYLSIARSGINYMTSTRAQNGAIYELAGNTSKAFGEKWLFEFPENGKVNIYYLDAEGTKHYLNVDTSRSISFSETPQALSIEQTTNAEGTFYIYTVINNKNYALSVRGNRNFFFENRNNGANANERVVLTKYTNDPYGLDGKTFGIAYNDDSTSAAAMMAEKVDGKNRLKGLDMLIRTDVLTNSGNLLVAENSDIQEWTFESVSADLYYIKTTVEGTEKYLCISGSNVTLVDDKASASPIQAIPGTDANSGK